MSYNLNALVRYHAIDACLQNKFRKYTIKDLQIACADALNENRGTDKPTVGQRTIEDDLRVLKSDILGYNAPIVCKNGVYSYSVKGFSIRNCSLSQKDLETISIAIKILKQYRGFQQLEDLEGIFSKMETQLFVEKRKDVESIVDFEKVPFYKGSEYIGKLVDYILNKEVIELKYQRYIQDNPKVHVIHPYFLKEYAHRWYLIGLSDKRKELQTFALDRILEITEKTDSQFIENTITESSVILKHTLGISMFEREPEKITLSVNSKQAKYLKSQPIHDSQKIIKETDDETIIEMLLVVNYELISKILSMGSDVSVVAPKSLRKEIKSTIKEMLDNY